MIFTRIVADVRGKNQRKSAKSARNNFHADKRRLSQMFAEKISVNPRNQREIIFTQINADYRICSQKKNQRKSAKSARDIFTS